MSRLSFFTGWMSKPNLRPLPLWSLSISWSRADNVHCDEIDNPLACVAVFVIVPSLGERIVPVGKKTVCFRFQHD